MSKLIPHRLDIIENKNALSSSEKIITEDFPTHQFDITGFLTETEIKSVAKLLINSLQLLVAKAETFDVKKYVFNLYSKNDFANDDFYDLLASVFDYLEQVSAKILDSRVLANKSLVLKAIESTISAATVLTVKRNPLISQVLSKSQKEEVRNLNNLTVKNVNMLESNRNVEGSNNNGNKMNQMMKAIMMSKMMSKDSKIDPTLLMMMGNKGDNNDMMKTMLLMSQMKKKDNSVESSGSNMDPMMMFMMNNKGSMNPLLMQQMMGGSSNPEMMKMMMLSKMFKKKGQNTNANQAWMNMYSNPGMGYGSMMNGGFNPFASKLYNDPELTGERSSSDPYMEMLERQMKADQKAALEAQAQEKLAELMKQYQGQLNESDDDLPEPDETPYEIWGENWHEEDKVDEEIKVFVPQGDPDDGEIVNSWCDDEEDDEDWGMVRYEDDYEEEHAHIFEMLRTDADENVGIESGTINISEETAEEYAKRKTEEDRKVFIEEMIKDQKLVIEKFFNGKVPEGSYIKEIDDVPHYLIPSERIFDGNYRIADTLLYYFKNGQVPPATASSLPVTIKGKTKVVCMFTSDGVRADIILPDTEETNVDIENHIPPKAIVEWRKLKEEAIFDDSGKKVNDHVVIMENELVGTVNSASITANCYAIASEEIDLSNSEMKPVEYKVNDPVGFYVDDVKPILDNFGADKEIDNISSFIKSIKGSEDLHSGVKAYIDEKGTEVINDFLLYSMVVNVKVDSFLEDYDDLEAHIIENYDESIVEYLRKAQKQLTKAICNAITGDEVDNLEAMEVDIEVKEMVDGKEIIKTVSNTSEEINKNLVVFNNKTQVTELPWDFAELNIGLVKQLDKADPFALLTKDSECPEIYEAIEEVALRASIDEEIRKADIITKDRVTLSIIQSAFDDYSFMLVKRSK